MAKDAGRLIQVKASGLMCSFCTMSVEKALGRLPGVRSVQVNLVHGIILVDADPSQITEQQVAQKVEKLGYTVVGTEAQQYATDEAIFTTVRRRGFLAVALAIADTLFDPLNLFGIPDRVRTIVSAVVALVVLVWIGYPILCTSSSVTSSSGHESELRSLSAACCPSKRRKHV